MHPILEEMATSCGTYSGYSLAAFGPVARFVSSHRPPRLP